MPLYEYQCAQCREKFDVRRGIFETGKDKTRCPKCGSKDTDRVFSVFGRTSSAGSSSCAPTPTRRFG